MASSTLWVCRSRHWTTTSRRPDSLKMDSAWPLVSLGRLKKTFQLRRLKCQIDESCEKMQLAEEHAWNERQCVDENSRQLSGNTVSQRELHIAHNTWPLHKNGWVASSWQAWPPSRSSVSCPILPSHWRRGEKSSPQIPQEVHSFVGHVIHRVLLILFWRRCAFETWTALIRKQLLKRWHKNRKPPKNLLALYLSIYSEKFTVSRLW